MQEKDKNFADGFGILEARWLVICLVAIMPLWIWPLELEQAFINLGISLLQALGWVVGLAAVVVVSTLGLSTIAEAVLKSNRQASKQ